MAKFSLHYTNTYLKDLKLARRRRLDENRLNEVIKLLLSGEPLPACLHNHILTGDYKGYWECHIRSAQRDALLAKNPDWLLLYEKDTEIRIISLYRTGTHADIFGKGKKR